MTGIVYLQGGLALVLQVFLLQALIRNGGRRYLPLTLYISSLFLSTVMELSIRLSASGPWTRTAKQYYWTGEVIQQVLVLVTIISFLFQPGQRAASRLRKWLIPSAVLGVALSLYLNHDPRMNFWMTSVSRDVSFLATLLNVILWGVLLKSEKREPRLLMVSGGLGIQLAGNAMGHGLRLLWEWSKVLFWMGNIATSLTYLLSLYVLFRAFRKPHSRMAPAAPLTID